MRKIESSFDGIYFRSLQWTIGKTKKILYQRIVRALCCIDIHGSQPLSGSSTRAQKQ